MLVTLALLLTGCKPNHAEISGQWHVWLAANNSGTVDEGDLDVEERADRIIDCSGRGWDEDTEDFEVGYIGPRSGDDYASGRYFGGNCAPDDSGCDQAALDAECDLVDAMEYFTFLQRDGFYYLTDSIETWRSEAIINGEGDLQITFHDKLGSGQDFRLVFVIKPDFAPRTCVDEDGDGVAETVTEDGSSWIDSWSANQGLDGSMYYLNAGGQQSEPGEFDQYGDPSIWYHTSKWSAGFSHSRFAAEDFTSQPNQYGLYDEDGFGLHFEVSSPSTLDTYWGDVIDRLDPDMDAYAGLSDDLKAQALEWSKEISGVAIGGVSPAEADTSLFELKVEDNAWRPMDTVIAGLDGWMEIGSSWATVDAGSTIEVGGSVSGSFQVYLKGYDSSSAMVIRGDYSVDKIHKDAWDYEYLPDEKREESGNEYCQ